MLLIDANARDHFFDDHIDECGEDRRVVDNGRRAALFAEQTGFKFHTSPSYTWKSQQGTEHKLDYIALPGNWTSMVQQVG
eukprot:5710909-Karenia_brevis.AAC.1